MIASVFNPEGTASVLLICEHASNHVPPGYASLGLSAHDLARHIAWDPGALPLAQALSRHIDAPLVFANVSRLVIDLNRQPGERDSIPQISETTCIPGNLDLAASEADARAAAFYHPFHQVLADLAEARRPAALISIHSFTPVYKGIGRPWHAGVITARQCPLGARILAALKTDPAVVAGLNVPYAPSDRVYHTLDRHARAHQAMTAMVEIRNDLIRDASGQRDWALRLAGAIGSALQGCE